MPCSLSCKSKSLLAKSLEHECSVANNLAGLRRQLGTDLATPRAVFEALASKRENALPFIVTHGWPGWVIERLKFIDPLANPAAHGRTASDAFHLGSVDVAPGVFRQADDVRLGLFDPSCKGIRRWEKSLQGLQRRSKPAIRRHPDSRSYFGMTGALMHSAGMFPRPLRAWGAPGRFLQGAEPCAKPLRPRLYVCAMT